jgi:hypothetical protein
MLRYSNSSDQAIDMSLASDSTHSHCGLVSMVVKQRYRLWQLILWDTGAIRLIIFAWMRGDDVGRNLVLGLILAVTMVGPAWGLGSRLYTTFVAVHLRWTMG